MSGFTASLLARARSRLAAWACLLAATAAATAWVATAPPFRDSPAALGPLPYAAVAAALLATHGVVAGPLRSGELLLWLQKPRSPSLLLLRWLAEVHVLTASGVALAVLAAALVLAGTGAPAGDALALLPALLIWGVAAAAVGFAVSATGVHPDGILAVLWIFAVSPFLLLASEGGADASAAAAGWLAFPYQHLAEMHAALPDGAAAAAGPAGHVLLHAAIWSAAGLLIALGRARSPRASTAGR